MTRGPLIGSRGGGGLKIHFFPNISGPAWNFEKPTSAVDRGSLGLFFIQVNPGLIPHQFGDILDFGPKNGHFGPLDPGGGGLKIH